MSINKKIIEAITPLLSVFMDGVEPPVAENTFTGKFKLNGTKNHLLFLDKDNFRIKINKTWRDFIIIDLDDTAFPAEDYNKDLWKQKVLVFHVAAEGKPVFLCVASKVGKVVDGTYFFHLFNTDVS